MQVENVAGISLTARGTLQQERQGTVRRRMLRQIVVYDQNVLAVLHPLLADRTARVRGDVLQRRELTRRGSNDRGVIHGAVLLQRLHDIRYRGRLLADGYVDAQNILFLLVNDRIDRDGRFTGLAVADDQLTLSAADGHHGVDRLDTGLQRHADGLTCDNTGRHALDLTIGLREDGALAVDRLAERIHHASTHGIADRDLNDATGRLDHVALADISGITHHYNADIVLFQVQDHAVDLVRELQQLTLHGLLQTVHAGNAVRHLNDRSHVRYVQDGCKTGYLFFNYRTDLFRF